MNFIPTLPPRERTHVTSQRHEANPPRLAPQRSKSSFIPLQTGIELLQGCRWPADVRVEAVQELMIYVDSQKTLVLAGVGVDGAAPSAPTFVRFAKGVSAAIMV